MPQHDTPDVVFIPDEHYPRLFYWLTGLGLSVAALTAVLYLTTPQIQLPRWVTQRGAELTRIIDAGHIIQVVDSVDRAVDTDDWDEVRRHLADTVAVDFTGITGGAARPVPADTLIAQWRRNLRTAKGVSHLRTNHAVTVAGEFATLRSHGYVMSRTEPGGPPAYEAWGVFEHKLMRTADGWKIQAIRFLPAAERGVAPATGDIPIR